MSVNSNLELQRNITKVCRKNGFTRKEVLLAVHINGSKRNLTVDELEKLTSYLNVRIQDLFI
jgi:hypothetical protein